MQSSEPGGPSHPVPVAASLRALRAWLGTPSVLAALVLAASVFITTRFWSAARNEAGRVIQAEFDFRVHDAQTRVSRRMDSYEQVLRGVEFLRPDRVNRPLDPARPAGRSTSNSSSNNGRVVTSFCG